MRAGNCRCAPQGSGAQACSVSGPSARRPSSFELGAAERVDRLSLVSSVGDPGVSLVSSVGDPGMSCASLGSIPTCGVLAMETRLEEGLLGELSGAGFCTVFRLCQRAELGGLAQLISLARPIGSIGTSSNTLSKDMEHLTTSAGDSELSSDSSEDALLPRPRP
mmetsp:Transcript_2304/g.7011  ORF Transcript_2304/g.7011 Transcript_2304/m.7011 type:complete len:164 (-) Transcript_2304:1274-1765(-)